MNLNWNLHPLEISRRIKCFYRDCLQDFEIRHPETRRRIALQLKMQLSASDRVLFEALLKRFETAKMVISVFDWPILFEWNEWRLQAQKLAEIQACLQQQVPEDMDVAIRLKDKLQNIVIEMHKDVLEDHPSFFRCIQFRWKFSAIRNEAEYYVQRMEQILPSSESLAS